MANNIKEITGRGHHPVIVAVSRKMPRFIEWFKSNYNSFTSSFFRTLFGHDIEPLLNITEIISEIALPFLCSDDNIEDKEFIVVDDIAVHGNRLNEVASAVFALTRKRPVVSCIAVSKSMPRHEMLDDSDFEIIPRIDDEEIDRFCTLISSKITSDSLPIDFEFPIFNISGDSADKFNRIITRREILRTVKLNFEERLYLISDDRDRWSVDLKLSHTSTAATDFSKVRFFFRKNSDIVFEIFSPVVISEFSLLSIPDSPFSHARVVSCRNDSNPYEDLWLKAFIGLNRLLDSTYTNLTAVSGGETRTLILRSLVVWCNYLFSLSAYIRNRSKLLPERLIHSAALSRKDLELIIGKNMTEKLYPILQEIIGDGTFLLTDIAKDPFVKNHIHPDNWQEQIESNAVTSLLMADLPHEVAEGMFRFMHHSNPALNSPDNPLRERPDIGETYFSIQAAMMPFYMTPEDYRKMREWVDDQIDASRIIPGYAAVKNTSGETFWRRFFFAGLRKFPDPGSSVFPDEEESIEADYDPREDDDEEDFNPDIPPFDDDEEEDDVF